MHFRGICSFCGQAKEGVRRLKKENKIMCYDCWRKDNFREQLEEHEPKGGVEND